MHNFSLRVYDLWEEFGDLKERRGKIEIGVVMKGWS
jgi:hypothetical protein